MKKTERSLWRCDERVGRQRVGRLGELTTDQPWFYAPIAYDDPEQGARFEAVCHFLYVVSENLPDSDDPVEDDRIYEQAIRKLGLEPEMVEGFVRGPWEILREEVVDGEPVRGGERLVIDFHSLHDGAVQWRGPMDRSFFE